MRQAVKKGAQVNVLHAADDDLLMPAAHKIIVSPAEMAAHLTQVLQALLTIKQKTLDLPHKSQAIKPSAVAQAMAASLASGERVAVMLGNFAQQHPQATQLHLLAQHIAALCGGKFGFIGEAANSVGGYLAQAVPFGVTQGMNAAAMLATPRKAYLLLNVEAELDTADGQQAISAMRAASMVVAMSAYKHHATDYADVLLPIAPFTETSGTFISTEGRVQSFKGAVKPLAEARPAWKVLRVLGNLLNVPGFDHESSEAVRDEALHGVDVASKLNNALHDVSVQPMDLNGAGDVVAASLQRVADVPIYFSDAIVRRSAPLQATRDASLPAAYMHSAALNKFGVKAGEFIKVSQGQGSARLNLVVDDSLPQGVVRVAAGHAATATLGAMFGTVTVERA